MPRRRERFLFKASAEGLSVQLDLLEKKGFPGGWLTEYKFHPTRRWRFDFANEVLKIAVEYQGGLFIPHGGHQTVRGMRAGFEKLNEAQLLGWIVLQFGPDETREGTAMNMIERAVLGRLESAK